MDFADGSKLPVDLVVFATGVRPRDELARDAGLAVGERGGVVVDEGCATAVPGRLRDRRGRLHRGPHLGAGRLPATRWPRSSPTGCSAAQATFPGADISTKLKLLGVDVASFGDAFAESPGALEVVYADPVAGAYKKLVVSDDAQTLLGGVLVGDASAYASLRPMVGQKLGADPTAWLLPEGSGPGARDATCPTPRTSARATTSRAGAIRCAVTERGLHRPRRREGLHQGRHLAAAPACRWSRSW